MCDLDDEDPNIEIHEYAPGTGPEVRTGISPQCQTTAHFDCPNFKFEAGLPPLCCVCVCHLKPAEA
jgi:hypothetical protein